MVVKMNKLKVLLSAMFVFTAVIRTSEVGECHGRRRSYNGIHVTFIVNDEDGTTVSKGEECQANWPELERMIKFDLKQMQEQLDYNTAEHAELLRLRKAAKELTGAEVRGN